LPHHDPIEEIKEPEVVAQPKKESKPPAGFDLPPVAMKRGGGFEID
jgi:hypothetical protein